MLCTLLAMHGYQSTRAHDVITVIVVIMCSCRSTMPHLNTPPETMAAVKQTLHSWTDDLVTTLWLSPGRKSVVLHKF